MKKIFLIIWADPKFYQTLIFLSQKFSKNKFDVYIICRNLTNLKDVIKKVNFGKNVKLLKSPNFLNAKFNLLNYIIFNFFIVIHIILKNPKNVIYFNKKALFNIFFAKIFKKKINKIEFFEHIIKRDKKNGNFNRNGSLTYTSLKGLNYLDLYKKGKLK